SAAMVFGQALLVAGGDSVAAKGLRRCRAASDQRAARSAEIRQRFAKALDAFAADDLASARRGFGEILRLHPEDSETRTMLGRVERTIRNRDEQLLAQADRLAQAGLYDDAQNMLDQVRAIDPGAEGLARAGTALTRSRQGAAPRAGDAKAARGRAQGQGGAPRPILSEH